jgi:hypothetical protein
MLPHSLWGPAHSAPRLLRGRLAVPCLIGAPNIDVSEEERRSIAAPQVQYWAEKEKLKWI